MIVCVCNNVSEREIADEVAGGCRSFYQLQERCGVAAACGTCHESAVQTFDRHSARPIFLDCGGARPTGVTTFGGLIPIRVRAK